MSEPTAVALALIAFCALLAMSAIWRFSTVEDVMKVLSGVSGLMGIVVGAIITYYFTNEKVEQAEKRAATLETSLTSAQTQLTALADERQEMNRLAALVSSQVAANINCENASDPRCHLPNEIIIAPIHADDEDPE